MFQGLTNGQGPISHGTYTATLADATNGSVALNTGLTKIQSAIVQVIRSGNNVASDIAISWSGGTLTVGSGSTYVLTSGDVVAYHAIGQ